MGKNGSFGNSVSARHAKSVQLLVALVRSLRRVELCRRDFIVLLGTQVPLSAEHKGILQRAGVLLYPAPPIIPGVPTADKLLVWRLTNYSQLAVLDADLLVLKPIDDVFGGAEELTIAHHPYDHLQAQCDVPVQRRGIAALFVMRPSLTTYDALMSYLLRRFKREQLLYSDQTGLMCFFGNRSRTLPCNYVYDVSMMSDGFLPRWVRNCGWHVAQHVTKNCLPDIVGGCRRWATPRICEESHMHMVRHCSWAAIASEAHAVHFKGNRKPWASARTSPGERQCRFARHGLPGVRPDGEQVALEPTDQLIWNTTMSLPGAARPGACISLRWRLPVYWARRGDGPVLGRKCCGSYSLMAAHWNALVFGGPEGLRGMKD